MIIITATTTTKQSFGTMGRQVILPSGPTNTHIPERLGWVHSICAQTVCVRTSGTVYGCDKTGAWDDAAGPTRYFVMCGLHGANRPEERDYRNTLNEYRQLKCYICGRNEKHAGRSLRVPLQCRAGHCNETADGTKRHGTFVMTTTEPCDQGMHVRCAMWGSSEGTSVHEPRRRAWFFPGGEAFQISCAVPISAQTEQLVLRNVWK
jgi:hypothetical protein